MSTAGLSLTRDEEDADVVVALEGVPWVRGVYVREEPRADMQRYVVHLTRDGAAYGKAEVHYRLVRSRGRADSSDVDLVVDLPPFGRHRRLELSPSALRAALARAKTTFLPEVTAETHVTPRAYAPPEDPGLRVLVVDEDPATLVAVRSMFPAPHKVVACPYRDTAVALLMCWPYDRVVVSDEFALGSEGLLAHLADIDTVGMTPVAVVAKPPRIVEALGAVEDRGRPWQVLSSPLDTVTLTLRFGADAPVDAFALESRSVARALLRTHARRPASIARPLPPPPQRPRRPVVLLVDATLEAVDAKREAGDALDVTIACTLHEAIAKLRGGKVDVMVCDTTARYEERPLYRELWRLFPRLSEKTLLVTSPETAASLRARDPLGVRRLVARPLTGARLVASVRFHRSGA